MADRSTDGGSTLSPHATRVSLALPPVTSSVPEARLFVDRALPATCWADEVTLLVSELASNAVRHARTPFTVSVACDGERVRVEVEDQDPTLPVRRRPDADAVTGRGLLIVDALAHHWGVEVTDAGKAVWVELACRSSEPTP